VKDRSILFEIRLIVSHAARGIRPRRLIGAVLATLTSLLALFFATSDKFTEVEVKATLPPSVRGLNIRIEPIAPIEEQAAPDPRCPVQARGRSSAPRERPATAPKRPGIAPNRPGHTPIPPPGTGNGATHRFTFGAETALERRFDSPRGAAGEGLTEHGGRRKFPATPQPATGAATRVQMSEQTANGRYENGRRFRLYEIIIAALLAAFFAALIASGQRTANRVDALDRKVEALDRKLDERVAELNRKVDENTRILVEVQTTLRFLVNGRIDPKEQAGPAADTPAPNEQLATKDP